MDFNLYREKNHFQLWSLLLFAAALVALIFMNLNFGLSHRYTLSESVFQARLYGIRWGIAALFCVCLACFVKPIFSRLLLRMCTRSTRFIELQGHAIANNIGNDSVDDYGVISTTAEFKVGDQSFTITLPKREYDGCITLNETFVEFFELRFDRNHRLIGAKLYRNPA